MPLNNNYYFSKISILVFLFISIGCQDSKQTQIAFMFGPDDANGSIQTLIDKFNSSQNEIDVSYLVGSRFSSDFYRELEEEFKSGDPKFHVVGADVVWTPAFAFNDWVKDMTEEFLSNNEPNDFLEMAMASVSYQYRIWGVPWFTDAGMMYYRKDLLDKNGIDSPPSTWAEMIEIAKKIQLSEDMPYGYVFQGADYEGGVANLCEFIWNADGQIILGDFSVASTFDVPAASETVITVNSQQTINGLGDAQNIIKSGITPENIIQYQEKETAESFLNGESVFMRSWASSSGSVSLQGGLRQDQIGYFAIPTHDKSIKSKSCLGGWNLMISSFASPEETAASKKFISFLISEESQRFRAQTSGALPTLRNIYEDESFLEETPMVKFAKSVIPNCKVRLKSPYYIEMSSLLSSEFAQLLTLEKSPKEITEGLEKSIQEILNSRTTKNVK